MKTNKVKKTAHAASKLIIGSMLLATPLMVSCDSSSNSSSNNTDKLGPGSTTTETIQNLERLTVGDVIPQSVGDSPEGIEYRASTSLLSIYGIPLAEMNPTFSTNNPGCVGFFSDANGDAVPLIHSVARSEIIITESVDTDNKPVFDVIFPPIIVNGDGVNTTAGPHTINITLQFGFVDDDNQLKLDTPTVAGVHEVDYYKLKITCDGHIVSEIEPPQRGEGTYTF